MEASHTVVPWLLRLVLRWLMHGMVAPLMGVLWLPLAARLARALNAMAVYLRVPAPLLPP